MDFPRAHWIPQAATMLQPCVAGLPGYLPMSSYDGGKGLPGLGEVGSQPVFPVGLRKKKSHYAYNFFHATRYYPESSALESPSKLPIFRMLTWVYLIFLM